MKPFAVLFLNFTHCKSFWDCNFSHIMQAAFDKIIFPKYVWLGTAVEGKQEMTKNANLQPLLFIEVHVHVARNLRHCMI